MTNKIYDIIRFSGQNRQYYGDSVVMTEAVLADGHYVPLSQMDVPMGQSRYGNGMKAIFWRS